MTDKDLALKYADQVATAIKGKLGKHNVYVRLHEAPEYSYIELGIVPTNGSPLEEKAVSYSVDFFAAMADVETKQKRAKRIFHDVRVILGLVDDEG